MKVIIFSHGLATWSDHYSTLLSHLSSLNFLVVAVEHSDGSATMARNKGGWKEFEVVEEGEGFKKR